MLFVSLTAMYFLTFLRILNLFFNGGPYILTDILWVVCAIAALILSVVLGDYTEKKLRAHYKRSDV